MMQILDAVKSRYRMLLAGPQVRCLSLCLAHLETVQRTVVLRTIKLSRGRKCRHLPNQRGISPIFIFRTVERTNRSLSE